VISAITGGTITFSAALAYDHYGSASPTVSNEYGTLDMRAGVALLTRNIVIRGDDSNGERWGCRVLVYGMRDSDIVMKGSVDLDSVEIRHCGQKNTASAGLMFQSTWAGTESRIRNSALHSCVGYCLSLQTASNLTIFSNVLYFAEKYLVYSGEVMDLTFSDNLLIHAQKRDDINYGPGLYDNSACFYMETLINYKTANVKVYSNLCQGSDGLGFGLPHVDCDFLDNQLFYDNTAGSCSVGFIYNRNTNLRVCQGASNIKAYSCEIGFMAHPAG
jgi:hypothetical protein